MSNPTSTNCPLVGAVGSIHVISTRQCKQKSRDFQHETIVCHRKGQSVIKKIKIHSTGSRTGQVKNEESYNSLVRNHLSASVGRHHPMIRRQMRLLNGGGG